MIQNQINSGFSNNDLKTKMSASVEEDKKELIAILMNYTPVHEQMVRELVARCPDPDLDSYNKEGFTLFGHIAFFARKPGYEKLLEILLDAGYKSSNIQHHVLAYAVSSTLKNGTELAVKIILEGSEFETGLERRFGRAFNYCISSILEYGIMPRSSERTLSMLLAYGVREADDENKTTCLIHYSKRAVHKSHKFVIEKLLEGGSSVTARSRFGETPFRTLVRTLRILSCFVECTFVLTMMIGDVF